MCSGWTQNVVIHTGGTQLGVESMGAVIVLPPQCASLLGRLPALHSPSLAGGVNHNIGRANPSMVPLLQAQRGTALSPCGVWSVIYRAWNVNGAART